jgi:hypothetical protein
MLVARPRPRLERRAERLSRDEIQEPTVSWTSHDPAADLSRDRQSDSLGLRSVS